jgi:hypothetical protein
MARTALISAVTQLVLSAPRGFAAENAHLLRWISPPDPGVAGYRVYLSTDCTYSWNWLDGGLCAADPNRVASFPLAPCAPVGLLSRVVGRIRCNGAFLYGAPARTGSTPARRGHRRAVLDSFERWSQWADSEPEVRTQHRSSTPSFGKGASGELPWIVCGPAAFLARSQREMLKALERAWPRSRRPRPAVLATSGSA